MDQLEPGLFQRMYRPTFDEIVGRITPFFRQRNERKACNSSGSAITVRTRVAVTLRWLAGASYLELCFAWGVSSSTFYSRCGVLWPTITCALTGIWKSLLIALWKICRRMISRQFMIIIVMMMLLCMVTQEVIVAGI